MKRLWIYSIIVCSIILIPLYCYAKPIELTASWYSVESLKKEGTWKYSKGVMANGMEFQESKFTCATRDFPLGTILWVQNIKTNRGIRVKVTDRINKKFIRKRIDLSKGAFSQIANLEQGLCKVFVEVVK